MKIKITTVREFNSDDYWEWILGVNMGDPLGPISGKELLEKGKVSYTSTDRIGNFKTTTATTEYEILEK